VDVADPVEGDEAFGRKTSSTAIPTTTKTTTAIASVEIASFLLRLRPELVKLAKIMHLSEEVTARAILTLGHHV
jgi:hypothetical protein